MLGAGQIIGRISRAPPGCESRTPEARFPRFPTIPILSRARGWRRCWRWRSAAGLRELLDVRLRIGNPSAANATAKVLTLVAGMLAGADSISDMDLLRHGGMSRFFAGVRAPITLGMFLRVFTFSARARPGRDRLAAAGPPRSGHPDPARRP